MFPRAHVRFDLAAVGLAALVGVGCAGLPGGSDAVRPLNVVVVTLDTLSARHLTQYGNDRIETPAFGRVAAEGVLFEQATATVPLTLPSHTSMFTGTYPMFNGVRDNGGYYVREDSETLAEALSAAGYRTGAFVAAFVVDSRWGWTRASTATSTTSTSASSSASASTACSAPGTRSSRRRSTGWTG